MKLLNLSPENNLLICCGRTEIDEDISYKIKDILSHPLDWGIILDDAYYHHTMQLLYHGLEKSSQQNLVPQGILAILRMVYEIYKFRNESYYEEARRVLESLEDAGINYVAYKGLFLAEKVYRDIALRPFNDVDILINRKDKEKANNVFSKLGYPFAPWLGFTKLNQEIEEADLQYGSQQLYERPVDNPVMRNLDFGKHCILQNFGFGVHYKLQYASSFWRLDEASVLKNRILTKLFGFDAFVPCYEDHLILLATHLYRHAFSIEEGDLKLFRFCDINETIRHFKNIIDWKRFVRSVKLQKVEIPVYYVLYFTEKLFGGQVPVWVLDKIRPKNWEKEKNILIYDWTPICVNPPLKVYGKMDFFYKLFVLPILGQDTDSKYSPRARMFDGIPKPVLNEMNRTLTERYNLKRNEDWEGSIQFIIPETYEDWYLIVKDKKCSYDEGILENPDITVEIPVVLYYQLSDYTNRKADLTKAALEGKVKVKGDIKILRKMQETFS